MGYVKQAEDLTGDLGEPFAALPESLIRGGEGFGRVSVFRSPAPNDSGTLRRRARDSNPWYACTYT
jgi:hypothetical protein